MMAKSWSSGNSYLRLVSSSLDNKHVLTLAVLSLEELQRALEAIQLYAKRTCDGEEKLKCPMEIRLSLDGSREMST